MLLISMTDFVLSLPETSTLDMSEVDYYYKEWEILQKNRRYAAFLKQPLTLSMFVPCDDQGNVLKEPDRNEIQAAYVNKYEKAKEKVLFKDFFVSESSIDAGRITLLRKGTTQVYADIVDGKINILYPNRYAKNIEGLITDFEPIELTESAIGKRRMGMRIYCILRLCSPRTCFRIS